MPHQPKTEAMGYPRCYRKVLTATVCLFQASVLLAQNAQVTGRVVDGTDHLPGATVMIGNRTTVTNIKGEFFIFITCR